MCLVRTELLRAGRRLTEAHAAVVDALGVRARVLPMCDEQVATEITAGGRRLPFQEFMIVERARGPLEKVELRGVESSRPTPEVLAALAEAELIVIGPSNPVISIGPVLAVPGMREAIAGSPAPVVAVSPFVEGRAVKGPTEMFCAFAGIERSAGGVARAFEGLIDGIVADEPVEGLPSLETSTLMMDAGARRRLARSVLEFGRTLR
jgi:LPPG:FO 2-phospho-L-lactate transferase